MDIHHLKVFLSVYKNRSFSKAGKELLITQPTISEHIKFLENYLNKRLFDRIGREIYPTEAGNQLYQEALKIVQEFENLKNKITGSEEKSLELDINSSSVPGNYILPKIINDFKKTNNNLVINIKIADSTEVIDSILSDNGLLGFIGTKVNNPKIEQHIFLQDEIVIIAEKNFDCPQLISIKDLNNFPLIFRETGSGTRKEVENFLEKNGFNLTNIKPDLIFGSNEALKQAVLSSAGIAFISKYCIENELKYKILKIIRLKEGEIKRNFYWIKKRGRTLPLVYKSFLDFIHNTN